MKIRKKAAGLIWFCLGIYMCFIKTWAAENGYDSPEDVVIAYVEGLSNQDPEEMLSVFAVETFVDHLQLDQVVEYTYGYFRETGYLPNISEFARQLNMELRESEVALYGWQQYLVITKSKIMDEKQYYVSDYNNVQMYLKDMFCYEDSEILDHIELKGFYQLEESETFMKEEIQKEIKRKADAYGGDEIRPVAAFLRINEQNYLLTMDVIRYGGRWYGLDFSGNLSSLCGTTCGLIRIIKMDYEMDCPLIGIN